MFESRALPSMRFIAIIAAIALITLVTAFDYEASGLRFEPAVPTTASGEGAPTLSGAPNDSLDPAASDMVLDEVGIFAAPIDVISRAGDNRLFVVELIGTITASNDTDGTDRTTVLDLTTLTAVEGERGLLGATFHPSDDLLYVHYSDLAGDSIIAEYAVDPSSGIADATSARTVLTVDQPYDNHNGGEVTFGPDGYLYLGFGDGGLADDPVRSALDLSSPLGKILRIDPHPSGDEAFTVPADNPFVDTPGADPTIWSYGLRNPWKFSFDPATGDLWIADVGQNQWEEINRAPADNGSDAGKGLSFGWSAYEGDARFNEDQAADGHTDPFVTYERSEGLCSISGGAVYRGESMPHLDGWYIYGDYCTGQIFGFNVDADPDARAIVELSQVDALVAVAAGPDGELYASSVMGPLYRLS